MNPNHLMKHRAVIEPVLGQLDKILRARARWEHFVNLAEFCFVIARNLSAPRLRAGTLSAATGAA
jgi:hypothetical protein